MTYEYLLAGLPELKAGSDAPISLEKLDELFDEQLAAGDKKLLELLRAPMDEATLAEGLKARNRFVREWFAFNQDMNNVLVAQICRKHGFDAKTQIVGEGEVAEQLRSHVNQKDFGLNEVAGDWTEILALAGKSENFFVYLLTAPGIWFQHITTKEPDKKMVEVAITAVEAVFDWKKYLADNFGYDIDENGEIRGVLPGWGDDYSYEEEYYDEEYDEVYDDEAGEYYEDEYTGDDTYDD